MALLSPGANVQTINKANISGGIVTATVTGGDGAAIGTCENGTGGTIKLTGGIITAKAKPPSAAVGAGTDSEPVEVYIDGKKADAAGEYDGSSNVFTYGAD